MNFVEFIGFIISIVAIIFITIKRYRDEKYRRQHPELFQETEEEKQQALKDFLSSIDIDLNDEQFSAQQRPVVPPPPPQASSASHKISKGPKGEDFYFKTNIEHYRPETKIEKRQLKTAIEERHLGSFEDRLLSPEFRKNHDSAYEIVEFDRQPRIQKLMEGLPSMQQMIIIREIIGPPKGMADLSDLWEK